MAIGTVRLKSHDLLDNHNRHGKTDYRVAKDGGLPRSTVSRLRTSENLKGVAGETLYGLLIGLGYTHEEAENLRLGDVFQFVEYEQEAVE